MNRQDNKQTDFSTYLIDFINESTLRIDDCRLISINSKLPDSTISFVKKDESLTLVNFNNVLNIEQIKGE